MGLKEDICPICDKKLETYADFQDGYLLLEEGKDCKAGCGFYSYQYAYGNYREAVWLPGFVFEVSLGWNSSDVESDRAAKQLDQATRMVRFFWRTGLWRPVWVIGKVKQAIENWFVMRFRRW